MPYYKSGIGKTPFFTDNKPYFIKYENCSEIKKKLEEMNIISVVTSVPNGCSVISQIPCKKCLDTIIKK